MKKDKRTKTIDQLAKTWHTGGQSYETKLMELVVKITGAADEKRKLAFRNREDLGASLGQSMNNRLFRIGSGNSARGMFGGDLQAMSLSGSAAITSPLKASLNSSGRSNAVASTHPAVPDQAEPSVENNGENSSSH